MECRAAAANTSFSSARLPKNETVKPAGKDEKQKPRPRRAESAAACWLWCCCRSRSARPGQLRMTPCKQTAQKEPLRDFARACPECNRRGRGVCGSGTGLEKSCGAGGRFKGGALRGGGRTRRRNGSVLHDDGSHAREIKAPQKGTHAQLAWPAAIDEELHEATAYFSELAGKFIAHWGLFAESFSRGRGHDAVIRQRIKNAVKCGTEPLVFFLGIGPARRPACRIGNVAPSTSPASSAGEVANEILEKGQRGSSL